MQSLFAADVFSDWGRIYNAIITCPVQWSGSSFYATLSYFWRKKLFFEKILYSTVNLGIGYHSIASVLVFFCAYYHNKLKRNVSFDQLTEIVISPIGNFPIFQKYSSNEKFPSG